MLRALLAWCAVVCAAAQPGLSGHWQGAFRANGRETLISLDLAQDAGGRWAASMGLPSQRLTGLYVKDLVVSGNSVQFVAVELLPGAAGLTLRPDGKLTGTISGVSQRGPIEFQRAGLAHVELPAALPPIPKDLHGNWEGTLRLPGGDLRIIVHLQNQPTVDLVGIGDGIPVREVKEAGAKVEFSVKQAAFRGALRNAASELIGEWGTGTQTVPLILRRAAL